MISILNQFLNKVLVQQALFLILEKVRKGTTEITRESVSVLILTIY